MKRFLAALALLFLAAHASAQFTSGQVLTAAGLNAALSSKANVSDLSATGAAMIGYAPSWAGSAARTQADKNREIVSILDFTGADATGATSSNTALASAVTYLSGGGKIRLPRGTYQFSNAQINTDYITLEGDGPDATIIINGGTNTPAVQWGDGTNQRYGGGLRGVRFASKAGVVGVSGQAGFVFNKVGQFSVGDIWCQSAPAPLYTCGKFLAASQFVVHNLRAQNGLGDGLLFQGALDAYVTDSRSDSNTGSGWVLDNVQGGYFKSDTAYNNTVNAWKLASTTPASAPNYNNWFIGCVGDTSGSYNWNISDSKNSYFANVWGATQKSTVVNTSATGFIVQSQYSRDLFFTAPVAINNNASGFLIYDPGSSAPKNIHLIGGQYGSTSNGANGNGKSGTGYGVQITGAADSIRIVGGAFYGNSTGAISNSSSGTDIIVSGNPVNVPTVTGGVGTIAGGTTTQVVNHGLGVAPNVSGIQVSETSNAAPSGVTSWWITNVTATQFTVNLNANSSGFGYAWRAAAPGN